MPRIFKRGSIWYAWIPKLGGGTRKRSTNCSDKRAAEIKAGEFERAAVDPSGEAQATKTIRDALGLMIAQSQSDAKAGEGSEATVRFYEQKAGSLLDALGDVLKREATDPIFLREMNAGLVDDFIKLRRAEVQDSTIRKELTTWRLAMKQAKRRRWWLGDLDELFPRFGQNSKPRDRYVKPEWIVPLMNAMVRPLKYRGGTEGPIHGEDLFAVVCFSIATSAEWSALWRARPEDIAEDLSSVHVRGSKNSLRDRVVPVQIPQFAFLLDYARKNGHGGSLLLFRDHSSHFRMRLYQACDRAGIPRLSPNDLRRTHAKWLRLAGVTPDVIATSMGHKDSRMVENVYGRASAEELARVQASQLLPGGLLMGESAAKEGSPLITGESVEEHKSLVKKPETEVPRGRIELPTRGFSILEDVQTSSEESPEFAEWWAANGQPLAAIAADLTGLDRNDSEKIGTDPIAEPSESGLQSPLSTSSPEGSK